MAVIEQTMPDVTASHSGPRDRRRVRWAWAQSHWAMISASALIVLGLLALLPNVFDGGFAMDDWIGVGKYMFTDGASFWTRVTTSQVYPSRLPFAIESVAELAIIPRNDQHLYLAFAALIDFASLIFLVMLLRRLRIAMLPATLVALITLIVPTDDATAFWDPESGPLLFGRLLPMVALLLAIRGLRSAGWRAVALQLSAAATICIAVWGYEIAGAALALSGVVYLGQAPLRRAISIWCLDIAVAAGTLILKPSFEAPDTSRSYLVPRIEEILGHGLDVLTYGMYPHFGQPVGWMSVGVAVALAAGLLCSWQFATNPQTRTLIRTYLAMTSMGVAIAYAGWVLIIPASSGYDPNGAGVENRVNVIAAVGVGLLVVGVGGLLTCFAQLMVRRSWLASEAALTVLVLPVLIGNYVAFHRDQLAWAEATSTRNLVLKTLHQLVPHPGADDNFFTFGELGYQTSGVPIFGGGGDDDLWWAVKVTYQRADLGGFPVFNVTPLVCASSSVTLEGTGVSSTTPYGHALFVDVPNHILFEPLNRHQCLADAARLEPYAGISG